MPAILDSIFFPEDIRKLDPDELTVLAQELREFIMQNTQTKAGHIRSSLGVTELTLALHHTYQTPEDILIWDVGHQAYVHKVLTGRKEQFASNRQWKGISGFTKRSESPFDPFGAGHSSTALSAAIGFAEADKLAGTERDYIAVIGDGALTGGECLEALNYLGQQQLNVTVILNDNQSSIDANVGALAQYHNYQELCKAFALSFTGLTDGHDIKALLNTFSKLKKERGPKMVRVCTQKGKGWHAPEPKPPVSRETVSFQETFAETLIALAGEDERVVAISPAMLSGSGLSIFRDLFPERTFDVGIAEQHAVTMAAAMAARGLRPFCHLYSTFAQRGYDQIIHDVALQNLPVVFCLDRAGLVGEDGPTHHGAFDVGVLHTIPGIAMAAPMDAASLRDMLREALTHEGPVALRYPKGGAFAPVSGTTAAAIGTMRQIKEGEGKVVISYGAIGLEVQKALQDLPYAHYDLRYVRPLDEISLRRLSRKFKEIIVVEENSAPGGAGETINSLYTRWNSSIAFRSRTLPDRFITHGSREQLLQDCGLDAQSLQRFFEN